MASTQAELLYKIKVEASDAVRQMEAVAGKVRGVNEQASNSPKSFQNMQLGVKNASYQLQDFIVQTSMGTDALRAFGQQAPQLLGSFGAIGAVVGVVASLAPAVIQLIKTFEDKAKSLEEAVKGVANANDLLKESFDFADRKTLDPLIEAYKKADQETRKLILSNMELNIAIAKVASNDLKMSLLNSLDEGVEKLGFFNRLLLETKTYLEDNDRLINAGSKNPFSAKAVGLSSQDLLKKGFGIDQDQLASIQEAQKQLDVAKISASEFFDIVSKVYLETKKPTKDFTDWVTSLQKATKASKELELQQKEYNKALDRIKNGDTSTTKSIEESRKEAEKAHKEWEKQKDKEIDQIQKEFDALQKLSEARTKEADQLRAMSDPMSAYNIALERANILLNDNKLSTDEYRKAIFRAETTLANSNKLVNGFGDALTNAFTGAMLAGKSFGDIMKGLATNIQATIVKIMVIEPLIRSLKLAMVQSGYFPSASVDPRAGGSAPVSDYSMPYTVASANGNVFSGAISGGSSNVVPFAIGGVVSRPTYFSMGNGKTGLAGEAGQEGILPLRRGSDGKLGVTASGVGSSGTVVNVYNQGSDKVETQTRKDPNGMSVIDIMIKKTVADGIANGTFDKAMGTTYGLRRQGSR